MSSKPTYGGALLLAAAVLMISGCDQKVPESRASAGPGGYEISTLFNHQGCTVYRFEDSLKTVYFTNCSGAAHYQESCGKGCTRNVTVD